MGKIHKQKSDKNPVGRPTVMTPEVIAKLEQVFAIDGSVEEACSYAEIGRNSFYDYLKINPDFSNRIADLRERPVLKARQTAVNKIDESYSNAMDYLKRKKKLEFGDGIDVTSGGKPIPLLDYTKPNVRNNLGNEKDTGVNQED